MGAAITTAIGLLGGAFATSVGYYFKFKQAQLIERKKELDNRSKELDLQEKSKSDLRLQVEDLTQQRDGFEHEWREADKENKQLRETVRIKAALVINLEDDCNDRARERDALAVRLDKLEKEHEAVKKQRDGLLHLEKRHGGRPIEQVMEERLREATEER